MSNRLFDAYFTQPAMRELFCDRARLQAYHDMLVVMRDRMRKEIAAKHTIEQVLASKITAEYDAQWPGGRERFLRILHQELSAAR